MPFNSPLLLQMLILFLKWWISFWVCWTSGWLESKDFLWFWDWPKKKSDVYNQCFWLFYASMLPFGLHWSIRIVMFPSQVCFCRLVLSHLQQDNNCWFCFVEAKWEVPHTSHCPSMLQLLLYCCMHKAHLWGNPLCMDFLREYFCTC